MQFTLEAGALVRGQIRRELERAAWGCGLEIKTDESKGLFESAYRFTVTGDLDVARSFVNDAHNWLREIQ